MNNIEKIINSKLLNDLTVDEILQLESYLEKMKNNKIGKKKLNTHVANNNFYQRNISDDIMKYQSPNDGKHHKPINYVNDYHNPYECGSRQYSLEPIHKELYKDAYDSDPIVLNQMGISQNMHQEEFPGKVRNVNVESALLQQKVTRAPGQRKIMEKECNRFNLLPFNPQESSHLVWKDNMPRGGYATRMDRIENQ